MKCSCKFGRLQHADILLGLLQPRNCEPYLVTAVLPMCRMWQVGGAAYEDA